MQRGRPAITISMPPEPCVTSPDVDVDPARESFEIFGDQLEERLANKIRVASDHAVIAGASLNRACTQVRAAAAPRRHPAAVPAGTSSPLDGPRPSLRSFADVAPGILGATAKQ